MERGKVLEHRVATKESTTPTIEPATASTMPSASTSQTTTRACPADRAEQPEFTGPLEQGQQHRVPDDHCADQDRQDRAPRRRRLQEDQVPVGPTGLGLRPDGRELGMVVLMRLLDLWHRVPPGASSRRRATPSPATRLSAWRARQREHRRRGRRRRSRSSRSPPPCSTSRWPGNGPRRAVRSSPRLASRASLRWSRMRCRRARPPRSRRSSRRSVGWMPISRNSGFAGIDLLGLEEHPHGALRPRAWSRRLPPRRSRGCCRGSPTRRSGPR